MRPYYPLALTATLLALASNAALAGSTDTYAAIDDNGDGRVSEREFHEYFRQSGVYDEWDNNDDGVIDDEEFADGLYDYYDDDDDGFISDAEWEDGALVDDYGNAGFWDM